MNVATLVEKVRIGAAEVEVLVAGNTLLPTANAAASCCCCCSSSCCVRPR